MANLITGTPNNDRLVGTSASDEILGLAGQDTIAADAGDDSINGGTGNDNMNGETGNDIYVVDAIGDIVSENPDPGIDSVQSAVTYTLGANVENLTLTGTRTINGTGNTLNNLITGNASNNSLIGAEGDDTLNGNDGNDKSYGKIGNDLVNGGLGDDYASGLDGLDSLNGNEGNDSLNGGVSDDSLNGGVGDDSIDGNTGNDDMSGETGNDFYVVDSTGDVVSETPDSGIDTVESSVTYTLDENAEKLILIGTRTINGTGNTLNNFITGNTSNNSLIGAEGDDTLNGNDGNDKSYGKIGNDLVNGGLGDDYASGLDGLDTLNGNEGNDSLNGGNDNDSLNGGVGDDIIDGGSGYDNMKGETGDDTYVVSSAKDVVTETADAGFDSAQSAVTHTLGANVENLTLTGDSTINGTGNGLDNFLTGNTADNTLNAGLGDDSIDGGTGTNAADDDLLVIDYSSNTYTGNDSGIEGRIYDGVAGESFGIFYANKDSDLNSDKVDFQNINRFKITGTIANDNIWTTAGNDTINGGNGDDLVDGGAGINTIDGGAGTDYMYFGEFGAATNDLLIDDNPTTVSTIALADGTSVKNVEHFWSLITGDGNDKISYSQRDENSIITGDGDDTINAGLGSDYVNGGQNLSQDPNAEADDDLLIIDYSSNTYNGTNQYESGIEGYAYNDVLGEASGSFGAYDSDKNYDRVSFDNINRFQITGTEVDDFIDIETFDSNDTINGGAGDDYLDGGTGINTIDGGAGTDRMDRGEFGAATNDLVIDDDATTVSTIALADGTSVKNVEHFENLITGSGNDKISYSQRSSWSNISTGEGDDSINAGLGRDYVDGGTGDNLADDDLLIVDYSSKSYDLVAQNGYGMFSDTYSTMPGETSGDISTYSYDGNWDNVEFKNINRFQITGTVIDDQIQTSDGDDTINGGAGDDYLDGGTGINTIDGGDGIDRMDHGEFGAATSDLVIDDDATTVSTIALADGTSVKNVENFGNLITGSGNDEISYSQRHWSDISTGEGDDSINAGLGNNTVDGGTGANAADDDLLIVDYSSKIYNGTDENESGMGSYSYSTAPGESAGSFSAYDSDDNRDQVSFANINRFQITGTVTDDWIRTSDGDDTINGGAGNDTINGSAGNDSLTGNEGSDLFNFYTTDGAFATNLVGVDSLTDFTSGDDKIGLANLTFDALTSSAGNGFSVASEFAVVGNDTDVATSDALIVYSSGSGSLFYNQNGAEAGLGSGAEFATGVADLSADDFIIQNYYD